MGKKIITYQWSGLKFLDEHVMKIEHLSREEVIKIRNLVDDLNYKRKVS